MSAKRTRKDEKLMLLRGQMEHLQRHINRNTFLVKNMKNKKARRSLCIQTAILFIELASLTTYYTKILCSFIGIAKGEIKRGDPVVINKEGYLEKASSSQTIGKYIRIDNDGGVVIQIIGS